MTMRMWRVVTASALAAGLALATLGGSLPLVFAVLVVLMASTLTAFLQWRRALRLRAGRWSTASWRTGVLARLSGW